MTADFLSGENLYQDVVTYSRFGEHRTATDGENQTTEWIAEQLQAAGLQTSFQPLSVETFFVHRTSLTVDNQRVECFPLWPPRSTGPRPIRARLALLSAGANSQKDTIVLIKASRSSGARPYSASGDDAALRTAAESGALAAVVICNGPSKEIHAYNTPSGTDVWPVPVVLVPTRDESALVAAAERGAVASLLVNGNSEPMAEARNVFGKLDHGKDIIVISTPKSGWFTCAGERGPGVALFLALARWAGQRQSPISYLFDCNTGHELMGLGIRRFLEELAPPPAQVLGWIHLGANIATWDWQESAAGLQRRAQPEDYRIMCSSPDLLPLLTNAFANMPGLQPVVGPGLGEMRGVIEAGYPGFGVNGGGYRFFHTPADVPEEATAPELLEPMALSLTRALESLEALSKR